MELTITGIGPGVVLLQSSTADDPPPDAARPYSIFSQCTEFDSIPDLDNGQCTFGR